MMLRLARVVIATFCILGMVYISAITRFHHPTLTGTQLLIEYWGNWLVVVMFAGIAWLMLTAKDYPY